MTDQNSIIDTVPSTRYPVYTRLNANDVMPDPVTPLGASLVWIPEILPAWAVGNVRLRYFTPEEMAPDPFPPVGGFFRGRSGYRDAAGVKLARDGLDGRRVGDRPAHIGDVVGLAGV